jgi:hypothetical protein
LILDLELFITGRVFGNLKGITMGTSIVACDQKFDIGRKVVLWSDTGGFDSYLENTVKIPVEDRKTGKVTTTVIAGKRYSERNPKNMTLEQLRKKICNFTVHHSATWRASSCYQALQNQRKLSVNFMIDDDKDATIYQCLDIREIGWSQGVCNATGPGVEICWQPAYFALPGAYSEANRKKYGVPDHKIVTDTLRGQKLKSFAPTDAQVESCIALIWGFCELFPDVKPEFPKDKSGKILKTHLTSNPALYNGLLGHFHITANKIDPLAFPFDYVESEVRKRLDVGH